ncbi:unnamed protein product [Cylicocyclus nassatus]|uniref:Uncharacterized protein n=1 Tax=Cylicocyclus nassatus TaxID=53992 RepID=A0AA36GJ56_CYLNA|nr:unnamed protein product [Cylicocyclus nassatus]
MVEKYMRTVERPSLDWRFKGAMAFHNEFAANGVQYIGSLTTEILVEMTAVYGETETESQEIKVNITVSLKRLVY